MHNREFKFGYQYFLLCQKSFLKVSSKWLLKNKPDNGKLLLGKTYSGERFRAILALLFENIVGKGENPSHDDFLFFESIFSTFTKTEFTYIVLGCILGRGRYTVLALSVLPSITSIFCYTFLSNHASQPFQTWYGASARGPTHRSRNSGPPVIYFLFPGLVHFWSLHLGMGGGGLYSLSKNLQISCFSSEKAFSLVQSKILSVG